jgi:hypothetical protein
MPTVKELKERLAAEPPRQVDQGQRPFANLFPRRLNADVILGQFEKERAPLETRDAVKALLAEARWARRTFWVSVAVLLVALLTLLVAIVTLLGQPTLAGQLRLGLF